MSVGTRDRQDKIIVDLKVENLRLQTALAAVLACEDPRCFLCASCLSAVQPWVREEPKPEPKIPWDDPVRTYNKTPSPRQKLNRPRHIYRSRPYARSS